MTLEELKDELFDEENMNDGCSEWRTARIAELKAEIQKIENN